MRLLIRLTTLWLALFSLALFSADAGYIKLEKAAVSSIPADLLIPEIGSLILDADGNVFAFAGKSSDGGECFIVKFDPSLRYVTKFGRDGKGPSEFTTFLSSIENRLSVDSAGNIYVVDSNPKRLIIYDDRGNYREDINVYTKYYNLVGNLQTIKTLGNGYFLGIKWQQDSPARAITFTLEPPHIKFEYTYRSKKIRIPGKDFRGLSYGENNLLDIDVDHFILAESQVYKFRLYDVKGNLKLEVYDKNRVLGCFSSKEMKLIRESYQPNKEYSQLRNNFNREVTSKKSTFKYILNLIEKSKNVIADVRLAGDRIFVFTVPQDITIKDMYPVEIYDLKGKLLKKTCFKSIPLKIWKNYAFYFEWDKEDNPYIAKYKMLDMP